MLGFDLPEKVVEDEREVEAKVKEDEKRIPKSAFPQPQPQPKS